MTRFFKSLLLMTLVFSCILICGCDKGKKQGVVTSSAIDDNQTVDLIGVVKKIDTSKNIITVYNTGYDGEEEFSFSGGTDILSKNDRDMSIDEVELGTVWNVYTDKAREKIIKLKEPEDIVEFEGTKATVSPDDNQIIIQDQVFSYSDEVVCLADGKSINPMEIGANDLVTFRGVKGKAYSIVVTTGHGFLRLMNYSGFVGGTLTVRGEMILPIVKGLLLTIPEGTQNIFLVKDDETATANVVIKKNKVTKLDVSKYVTRVPDMARVNFDINPQGAELYVDGKLQDYTTYVSLKYGNHAVKVTLEGYEEYTGVLHVKDANPTVQINLAQETATVTDATATPKSGSDSDSDSDNSSSNNTSSSTTTTDKAHKISISTPAGASVYVDGSYKGVAPCSFEKIIGELTLTLSKEGCETKSYTVTVTDDSQDVSWSFPDLASTSVG